MIEPNTFLCGDCLPILWELPDGFVRCCVTSPPYWGLRDFGVDGQLGLEQTPEEYVAKMVDVFREVRRVLKDDGTLWLNLGDSYWGGKGQSGQAWSTEHTDRDTLQKPHHQITGMKETRPSDGKHPIIKPKDLVGIPWRVAFALQADGWYLRQDIIWHKPNPMPESVTDRCTKAHEYIFLLSKSQKYYYDAEAIMEKATGYDGRKDILYKGGPKDMACTGQHQRWTRRDRTPESSFTRRKNDNTGYGGNGTGFQNHSGYDNLENPYISPKHTLIMHKRNKRSVWTVTTQPYPEAHFATFPEDLIIPCILAGSPERGIVLDPFMGSGTTAKVARDLNRNYLGIELNPHYIKLAEKRLSQQRLEI